MSYSRVWVHYVNLVFIKPIRAAMCLGILTLSQLVMNTPNYMVPGGSVTCS